jgi:hypothetical protein
MARGCFEGASVSSLCSQGMLLFSNHASGAATSGKKAQEALQSHLVGRKRVDTPESVNQVWVDIDIVPTKLSVSSLAFADRLRP